MGEGGGHQVDAVHFAPHEGDFGAAGAGGHLQYGELAALVAEEFEVEDGGSGEQGPGGGEGERADGFQGRLVVDLDGAERASGGELQAGVQVAGGPPGAEAGTGVDTVDVQHLVRLPRLHDHLGALGQPVRGELPGVVEAGDGGAGGAAAGLDEHGPAVVGGELLDGRRVRGGLGGGGGQPGGVQPARHDQLVAQRFQVGGVRAGQAVGGAEFGGEVQVGLLEGDDPGRGAAAGHELGDPDEDRRHVLGAVHQGHPGRQAGGERADGALGGEVADAVGGVVDVGGVVGVAVGPPVDDDHVFRHGGASRGWVRQGGCGCAVCTRRVLGVCSVRAQSRETVRGFSTRDEAAKSSQPAAKAAQTTTSAVCRPSCPARAPPAQAPSGKVPKASVR